MTSDEEIARRVALVEQETDTGSAPAADIALHEFKSTAGEIHDELARRIERVDDRTVDEETLARVVERLDRLESRLDDIETRL